MDEGGKNGRGAQALRGAKSSLSFPEDTPGLSESPKRKPLACVDQVFKGDMQRFFTKLIKK